MSEWRRSEMTRRELLKTVAGAAAVAGVSGLGVSPAQTQQSAAKEPIEVIMKKGRPVDDPGCNYPGFAPGVRVEDGMRIERDVMIKMRDGVGIPVDIYRPEGGANLPVIIAPGPGKEPGERERRGVAPGTGWGLVTVSKYAKLEGPDPVIDGLEAIGVQLV